MKKLLLLPLVLLLLSCRNSKPAAPDSPASETEPIAELPNQSPVEAISVGADQTKESQQPSIKQGIAGQVFWQQGNQMPSPDAPRRSSKNGVQRTVYIYTLTNTSKAKATGVFYSNIQTKLVTQVITDANGNFTVSLEPGKYSLFTKEEEGLFANLMDGEGNIYPVEVQQNQVTRIEFLINYNATY
ncbi:collagen binding domain-containing protein [Pontibacter arcticus]|uniref:Carboxypeptidase regulatory-like domain-containing protein n=1 Tax=Pontibacter arcticus TaxID=2080288 RepID=A0A364RIC4_9BACT|nr:carboxypeptidase regulatory-like domain-containing protein [Pontibacter arcticus]RAU84100.1 carboxypeptidase regulatory-like domain-containing protein [Pontibacter arcticus]